MSPSIIGRAIFRDVDLCGVTENLLFLYDKLINQYPPIPKELPFQQALDLALSY